MHFLRQQRWWITRILVLPLHLLVFTIITFILIRSVPGDPVRNLLSQNFSPADYAKMKTALGLDGSTMHQLGKYLHQLISFNLGNSLSTGRPVLTDFRTRLPATLELAILGLSVSLIFSAVASYVAVMHPRWIVSRIIKTYARTAGAVPEYVLAIVALYLFYTSLHWAPAPLGRLSTDLSAPTQVTGFPLLDTILTGYWPAASSMLSHLVLPVGVLVLAQSPVLIKLLISSLTDSMSAAPTIFRIASGASQRRVVTSIYRRAIPPAVTMAGTLFGYMLGGAVVLETLFGFAGMGAYAVTAVTTSDYPAMQGFLIVIAGLLLVVFLLVDLLNMTIDPRRRPGVRTES